MQIDLNIYPPKSATNEENGGRAYGWRVHATANPTGTKVSVERELLADSTPDEITNIVGDLVTMLYTTSNRHIFDSARKGGR